MTYETVEIHVNPSKKNEIAAASHILKKISQTPEIAILTGTGLGRCAEGVTNAIRFEYSEIPNFPVSTVESHPGQLVIGKLKKRQVAVFKGRLHLYEGYSPAEVAFPVRVAKELGVKIFIVSNAAGGLNPSFRKGDIMVISDHINLTGRNPLTGPHDPQDSGNRFPDMTHAYDPDLINMALSIGKTNSIRIQSGVYVGLTGPSLETPAETRFLQIIGASAVGFSTVMEVIAAAQAGMKTIGLSTITNINDPENPIPASLKEIISVANESSPMLNILIEEIIGKIGII